MDELALTGASLKHPADGGDVVDNAFGWNFSRLLTPTLKSRRQRRIHPSQLGRSAAIRIRSDEPDVLDIAVPDDPHEVMISAGLSGTIGKSGARGIGSDQFGSLEPGLFLGKGFGDAPNALAWLRPFAVTGACDRDPDHSKVRRSGARRGRAAGADTVSNRHDRALGDFRSNTAHSTSPPGSAPDACRRRSRSINSSRWSSSHSIRGWGRSRSRR